MEEIKGFIILAETVDIIFSSLILFILIKNLY